MKIFNQFPILAFALVFTASSLQAQKTDPKELYRVQLPNGWSLTPAGSHIPLGDLPLNMAVSPNKKWMAVTNNGQSIHSIEIIDIEQQRKIETLVIPKAWYGLVWGSSGRDLYVSGGHDNRVLRMLWNGQKLSMTDTFQLGQPWPEKIGTAGLAVDDRKRNELYVVTKESKQLFVFDLKSHLLLNTYDLGNEAYACILSPDLKMLYISIWGGRKVVAFDIESRKVKSEIHVGFNPNEMILDRKGERLFVANSQDNSVSIIRCTDFTITETLNAALYTNSPVGSTSNGLALSADEKTLYVANADNNCLAVFNLTAEGKSESLGFIPVGWYPTSVKLIGKQIYVANGKGVASSANPYGPNPIDKGQVVLSHQGDTAKNVEVQYIGSLFKGNLSVIPVPNSETLKYYTSLVYKNTPYVKSKEMLTEGEEGNPIPKKVGEKSPIKYVFYVIKENRTYDQVLGDVKGGAGDTSLLLFGEKVTPNQHKIVKDFTLLDHFFVDAEVSADGHNWSMGAYANDYVEKNWPASYGNKGGTHGTSATLEIGNNKDGFIWDFCDRYGVSYRSYGEFVSDDFGQKPRLSSLKGHSAPFAPYGLGVQDTTRFGQWKKDFDSLLASNALPQLSTIRLGNDHTEGMRSGRPTPFAHVADNDLAVGLLIEHISQSPIWKESAIFILEDDAQNGPDHIDAHRSPAYVVSPYVKRNFVDSTSYTTSGMLRTIELILGLPPMTQYDAAATPMWRSFTSIPNFSPFKHLPSNINLSEKNGKKNPNSIASILSEKVDWSKEDRVPDQILNEILWQSLKGKPAPAPVRSAFLTYRLKSEDDDD